MPKPSPIATLTPILLESVLSLLLDSKDLVHKTHEDNLYVEIKELTVVLEHIEKVLTRNND